MPRSLRIALVIEHFDASRGGAEHLTVWLATQLANAGIQVHVVCHDVAARINRYRAATQRASHDADRSLQAHTPEPELPRNIHIHRLRGIKLNTGLGFRRFGTRARNWCRQHRLDVVHSMTVAYAGDLYHPHAGVYARIQAQAIASRNTPAAAKLKRLLLQLSFKQRTLLALERRAVRPPDEGGPQRILAICRMMADQLHEHYAVPPERMVILENPRMSPPPDLSKAAEDRAWFRSHYGLGASDRVALFVGHDFRRKGLRWAIDAIAQTQTGWKLLVVGLGKVREYVEMVEAAGLAERVKFIGPTRQMNQVYAAGDALILPTFYDSFGLVVIEALSFGLPVISTRYLGTAELVRHHEVGTIVPEPRDTSAMAAALDALPTAPAARAALAARAREASSGMTGETYLRRIIELYHTLARRAR